MAPGAQLSSNEPRQELLACKAGKPCRSEDENIRKCLDAQPVDAVAIGTGFGTDVMPDQLADLESELRPFRGDRGVGQRRSVVHVSNVTDDNADLGRMDAGAKASIGRLSSRSGKRHDGAMARGDVSRDDRRSQIERIENRV